MPVEKVIIFRYGKIFINCLQYNGIMDRINRTFQIIVFRPTLYGRISIEFLLLFYTTISQNFYNVLDLTHTIIGRVEKS